MEAVVKFDYTKEQDDEIDLAVGNILTDVEKIEDGWCQGTLNGKRGLFPENFVELRPKTEPEPPKIRNELDDGSGRIRRAKVTFSYVAENEDELPLELAQVIDILGEEEEGWWRGRYNGKEGVFPSNFVEPIEEITEYTNITPGKPAEKGRPPSMIAMPGLGGINPFELRQKLKPVAPIGETKPAQPQSTSLQKAKVMFPYEADQSDELSVEEGEIVDVINKDVDQDGWWLIRGKAGKGLVPDNFLSLIESPIPHTSTSNVALVNETRSTVESPDNPPLPPKTASAPTVIKPRQPPAFGTAVMPGMDLPPKLPSKQPDLPPKNTPELDIPRQDVLDNAKAKDKPKRTARPPSRNTSGVDISEEVAEPPGKAPWQAELSKRNKTKPSPGGGTVEPTTGVVKQPPVVSSKPAPGPRPKPASKPSKPAVVPPKTPEPPVATPSPPSKPVAPLTNKVLPPSVAKEEVKPPSPTPPPSTTTTTTAVATESKYEWKEAFEQLKKQFEAFQQEIRQSMQKEIDILSNDLDEERKKTAMMQIDIDRLKKSCEFRDNNN